jgi:hypothetical protein
MCLASQCMWLNAQSQQIILFRLVDVARIYRYIHWMCDKVCYFCFRNAQSLNVFQRQMDRVIRNCCGWPVHHRGPLGEVR